MKRRNLLAVLATILVGISFALFSSRPSPEGKPHTVPARAGQNASGEPAQLASRGDLPERRSVPAGDTVPAVPESVPDTGPRYSPERKLPDKQSLTHSSLPGRGAPVPREEKKGKDDLNIITVPPPPRDGKAGEPVTGSSGHDLIDGAKGRDEIHGGHGDDVIDGSGGDDWIDGETGDDLLYGGDGNDTLMGGDGDNFIYGGPGDDWLQADHGIDALHGGPGADTLAGGGDGDTFVWSSGDATGSTDRIEDFNPDEGDILHLADILQSLGYRGDGSPASLDGYLRMSGTVLEMSGNGRDFTALVDLQKSYAIAELIAKGNLKAAGAPPARKE